MAWRSLLFGFGAAYVAPSVVRETAPNAREMAKAVVKASLQVAERAKWLTAEAVEQVKDLAAEVKAERDAGRKAG
jgi:hypothetical protein